MQIYTRSDQNDRLKAHYTTCSATAYQNQHVIISGIVFRTALNILYMYNPLLSSLVYYFGMA